MIVYRAHAPTSGTGELWQRVCHQLAVASPAVDQDAARACLLDLGEIEAAVADHLCPTEDGLSAPILAYRQATLLAARVLVACIDGDGERAVASRRELGRHVDSMAAHAPPASLRGTVPEGYAYYALFPEAYALAARAFLRETAVRHAVCIGIRSIGTSLSAVAAAALEQEGCRVESYTVRPHGHPFDRYTRLARPLQAHLAAQHDASYLVVDEGPGLSGSSLTSVAEALSELGIADERIVLLPSWSPDGSDFRSERARRCWPRHRKVVASFEEAVLAPGLLGSPQDLTDWSGGQWRQSVYAQEAQWPAVHPHQESRKYLQITSREAVVWKFSGLGRYGEARRAVGEALASAGYCPAPGPLRAGFVAMPHVSGRPLQRGDATPETLRHISAYLAHRAEALPSGRPVPFDALIELLRINVGEGLGASWVAPLDLLEACRSELAGLPTVKIDGRMMPHKWLKTARSLVKLDGQDHHDDHLFPGCQDIAWDLAGLEVEWGLSAAQSEFVQEEYRRLRLDRVDTRLPFYRLAYLAYRLGHTRYAIDALGPGDEGARLEALHRRYAVRLRRELYAFALRAHGAGRRGVEDWIETCQP